MIMRLNVLLVGHSIQSISERFNAEAFMNDFCNSIFHLRFSTFCTNDANFRKTIVQLLIL